jgi:CheY-like chemotaxis protein
MVLAVIDDLMFRSRVSAAAKASGTEVRFASGESDVLARLGEGPGLIIVDLNARRADPVALVSRLKSDPALSGVRVVGFVSHVDTSAIEASRAAGIDAVFSRGAFVNHLPRILSGEDLPRDPMSS